MTEMIFNQKNKVELYAVYLFVAFFRRFEYNDGQIKFLVGSHDVIFGSIMFCVKDCCLIFLGENGTMEAVVKMLVRKYELRRI